MEERDAVIKPRKTQTSKEMQSKMNLRKLRSKSTSIQPHSSAAKTRPLNALSERKLQKCDRTRGRGTVAAWERRKVAKMRLSNAAIEQKLPKRDRRMLRVSENCKNEIVCENGGQG